MGRVLRQQPTLWSDVFQAERGWGDFDNNDYVKHDEDEVDFKYDDENDNEDATRTRTGEM